MPFKDIKTCIYVGFPIGGYPRPWTVSSFQPVLLSWSYCVVACSGGDLNGRIQNEGMAKRFCDCIMCTVIISEDHMINSRMTVRKLDEWTNNVMPRYVWSPYWVSDRVSEWISDCGRNLRIFFLTINSNTTDTSLPLDIMFKHFETCSLLME